MKKTIVLAAAVTAVLLLVFGVLMLVRGRRGGRCTENTLGVVEGPSAINYAGHHIPLVRYEVNGVSYRVAGPKFESGTATPNAECNVVDPAHPPPRLVAPTLYANNMRLANEELYALSPLSRAYPVGSWWTVWYDRTNPKTAYVIRPVREGFVPGIVLLVLGICMAIVSAILFCLC